MYEWMNVIYKERCTMIPDWELVTPMVPYQPHPHGLKKP